MSSERNTKFWFVIGAIASVISIFVFFTNKSSVQELTQDMPVLGKKVMKCKYLQDNFTYYNYYLTDNDGSGLAEVKAYGDSAICTIDRSCPIEIFQLKSTSNLNQYYNQKLTGNDALRTLTKRLLTINKNSMDFTYELEIQHAGIIPMQDQYFIKSGSCYYVRESQIPNYFSLY